MTPSVWFNSLTLLAAGGGGPGLGPSGIRIALGLSVLVAIALLASHRRWWAWRRTPLGSALSTGGWLTVGLGLLVGPHVIGLVDSMHVDVLRPLVLFCLGWVGMMVGLQLRADLPKLLPEGARRLASIDALVSFVLFTGCVGGSLWWLSDITTGELPVDALAVTILAILLAACSVGWSSETRSLAGTDPNAQGCANLIRAASGLATVVAVGVFGVARMLVQHGDTVELSIWPMLMGLGIAVLVASVAGLMTLSLMRLAGRTESQFLVVLLGLVSFIAGAAAAMGYSPLFVAMISGIVVVNLPGNALAHFRRVIVDAEQPVAMILMLTAGVIADPLIGSTGWLTVGVLVLLRIIFKRTIAGTLLQSADDFGSRKLRWSPVRQAPVAVALAVGFAVSSHDLLTAPVFTGAQIVMIVVLVGLISEAIAQLSRLARQTPTDEPEMPNAQPEV